jgi:hypothetical protein
MDFCKIPAEIWWSVVQGNGGDKVMDGHHYYSSSFIITYLPPPFVPSSSDTFRSSHSLLGHRIYAVPTAYS